MTKYSKGAPVAARGVSMGPAVQAPKMSQIVAAQIRGQIVRGELAAGDHLPQENELLQQFGVSRPILREAFRILEQESLISVRRGASGGPRILAPNLSVGAHYLGLLLQMRGATLADVYDARAMQEPACAALMAQRAGPEDIAALRDCIASMEELIEAGRDGVPEVRGWLRLSNTFHSTMLNACGNTTMAVQGNLLLEIIAMHYAATVPGRFDTLWPSLFPRVLDAFRKLVELAEAHDVDGAREHWGSVVEFDRRMQGDALTNQTLLDLFA